MGHVDSSQIAPLYANTTPGLTADANVFDPAVAALIVAINENFDSFEAFKASMTLPIPDQSIVTRHLRDLAVTNPKLAPLAVTADKIANGAITLEKLADMVITAQKIADWTITEQKMANGSVSRRMIQIGAVGANEIDPTILTPISDATVQIKFNQIDERLADNAVSPEQFNGNDFDKLQAALDYAVTNSVAIKLKEMYDITGLGTLLINKPRNISPNTNRKPLVLLGVGGGIKKNDSGYVFSSTLPDVGEIFFDKLKFESVENAGTIIFDGNKLINIFSSSCFYLNCDTIAKTDTRYAQGWDFSRDVVVGGKGWAFEFDYAYAVSFDRCIIEWRENGIRNNGEASQINHLVNISGCTIEGLSGKAISINGTDALKIKDNYFEYNLGGYIDIKSACNGAEFSGNFFELTDTQEAASVASINLSTGIYKSVGNKSSGILYNMVSETTLYSDGDSSPTLANGNTTFLYPFLSSGASVSYDATLGVTKKYGAMTSLTNTKSLEYAGGEIKQVDIPFAKDVYNDDLISVTVNLVGTVGLSEKPQLLSFYKSGANVVTAFVKNNYAGAAVITATCTVVKAGNLSYYG